MPKNPWPATVTISLILGWLSAAILAVLATLVIFVASLMAFGVTTIVVSGILIAVCCGVLGLLAVIAVAAGLMLTRLHWTRVLYTVPVLFWMVTWLTGLLLLGGFESQDHWLVTAPTLTLVISVVLVWLPASHPFFCRRINVPEKLRTAITVTDPSN